MAKKFNASEISIWGFLNNNGSLFNVPIYQRGYSWTKEEARTLYVDLYNFSKNRLGSESYYIGNIVLQPESDPSSTRMSEYQVVDGQQRITTMLLIIGALRNELTKRINSVNEYTENTITQFKKALIDLEKLLYFDNYESDKDKLQLKIYNKDFDQNMRAVIENTINDELNEDIEVNPKYRENYNAIHSAGIVNLQKDEILDFIKAFQNIILVEIVLSSDDKALSVFENINSKGHFLSAHDLIKNYLYILTSSVNKVDREKLEETVKKIFDDKIYNNIPEKERSEFWKLVTSIISNKKQSKNDDKEIYKSFKEAADNKYHLVIGNLEENELSEKISELLSLLNANYEIYIELQSYKADIYRYSNRWERSLASIMSKSFSSAAPILFKAFNDYKDEKIDESQLHELLITLNKYIVRRKLAYDGIKDLKNFAMKIVTYLTEQNLSMNRINFIDYVENIVKDNRYNKNIDNINFVERLKTSDTYNNAAALDILVELEWSLNKNEGFMVDSKRKVQIEHVMPQTIYDSSKDKYYPGWDHVDIIEHTKFVDTIGNLTLTFDNQELGNKSFNDKKKIISESKFRINEYFKNQNDWDINEITKRSKEIQGEIIKLWEL